MDTVLNFCQAHGFAFSSRRKTVDSLAEKIETGRFGSWSELDDLFACTVIVPTLVEEPRVIDFCCSVFDVIRVKKLGDALKAPDVFRFDSTRIYARLKSPEVGMSNMEGEKSVFDVQFEVQVRTAFEHAWSMATHSLAYKTHEIDWKRLRLASQLKATVEQLDALILAYDQVLQKVSESRWPDLEKKKKISDATLGFFEERLLPEELLPRDLSRFSDNLYALLKSSSTTVNVTRALRIIEEELRSSSIDRIPRSISLLQYFLAILITRSVLQPPFENYVCHITPELLSLYPNLKDIDKVFGYNT
ncbi:hypothetical protein [Kyrpidia spormannii]|uniref:hypothetical protein n=1 Tax=Kyrpidia spormannii TaxID=2055160 RepID=UPI0014764712|nr:hypothetical protein [Kyrpidia spormannii]